MAKSDGGFWSHKLLQDMDVEGWRKDLRDALWQHVDDQIASAVAY